VDDVEGAGSVSLAEDIPQAPRFESAEAFIAWAEARPERYELVDGIVRMMTGGSLNHGRLSRNTLTALVARLGSGPCEAFGPDVAVILGPRHVAFPDATVTCEPVTGTGIDRPSVVFEVLSPSTAAYDLGDKAHAYRGLPSLRHLVLVSQDRIRIEHYHREAADDDFVLTAIDRVDAPLELTAIGAEIPVVELYAQVTFA
jgi:Uma2 family endonuclease